MSSPDSDGGLDCSIFTVRQAPPYQVNFASCLSYPSVSFNIRGSRVSADLQRAFITALIHTERGRKRGGGAGRLHSMLPVTTGRHSFQLRLFLS